VNENKRILLDSKQRLQLMSYESWS